MKAPTVRDTGRQRCPERSTARILSRSACGPAERIYAPSAGTVRRSTNAASLAADSTLRR